MLDQIIEDQQSEMYRDVLIKEKRVREEAERRAREAVQMKQEVDAKIREKDQQLLIVGQQMRT